MVIQINYNKCLGAEKCGKCLKVCPQGVFMNVPEGRFEFGKEPKRRKIVPFFREFCNKCGLCVKNCPQNAILLTN